VAVPDLTNVRVIDADGHVRDRDADIRKFMAEPYCRRQGSLLPNDVWDSSMYGKLGMNITDVPTRLRDMDKEGIDISVLFPTGGFGVTQLPEKDYAAAFCRGYNDWVASVCAESPRLKGVGLVPFVSRCRCRSEGSQPSDRQVGSRRHHRRLLRPEGASWTADVLAHLRRVAKTQRAFISP